jgi:hypothetical protein
LRFKGQYDATNAFFHLKEIPILDMIARKTKAHQFFQVYAIVTEKKSIDAPYSKKR